MAWSQKLSKAHIIIIVSGILAFTSTFAYLNSLDQKIMVAKLKHDVIAGEVISSKDVNFVPISNDNEISNLVITKYAITKDAVVSRVDLKKQDLLTTTNTSRRSTKSGLQSLSITLDAGRANGGDIITGDSIDVYETGDDAHLVASSLEVRSIIKPSARLGISTSKELTIVVAVNDQQASELSKVIGSKDMMVVLATGSKNTTTTAATTTSTTTQATTSDGYAPIDLNTSSGN